MTLLPGWWRRYFLGVELALSVFLSVAFGVWVLRFGGATIVYPVLTGAEASIYGTLATIFGSLLGFVITSVSIIVSLGDSSRLAVIRESRSNQQLWKIFTSATKWLGVATGISLTGLILNRDGPPEFIILVLCLWSSLLAVLRLVRCIWALENVVKIVAKPLA
jgi:hypothetical protein